MFCDTKNFSARLPVKVFRTINGRQFYILSNFHKIERKAFQDRLTFLSLHQLESFDFVKFTENIKLPAI